MIVRDAPSSLPAVPVTTPAPQAPQATRPSRSPQRRSSVPVWVAYMVAVIGMVAVGAGGWFFPAVFAPLPSALVVLGALVVVLAAGLGGYGPGLLATALGTGMGVALLRTVGNEPTWRVAVAMAVFAAFGVLVSVLNAARLRATGSAAEAQGELFTVLGDLSDGVLLRDPVGGLLFANDAAARLVGGASGEELRQATMRVIAERFAFLDAQGQSMPAEALFAPGAVNGEHRTESVFEVRDRMTGQARWWSVRTTPLLPARKGYANATVTIFRDVTVQRQADAALATSERRFRALIAHSADAFVLLDARGGLLFTSPAVSTILGYREDELRGASVFSLVHPNDMAQATALVDALHTADVAPTDVFRMRHHDGRWRWIEATGSDLTTDPAVRATLLNVRDITDRKRAEDARAATDRRFHALLDHTAEAITVTDATGDVMYASPSTERILGYAPDTLAASNLYTYIHPADVPQVRAFFGSLTSGAEARAVAEYRVRHRDGAYHRMEMIATNLLHDPAVRGIVGNYRDVTERARVAVRQQFLRDARERFAATPADEDALAAVAATAVPQFAAGCAVEMRHDTGKLRRAFTVLPSGISDDSPDPFATTPAAAYVARALITGKAALFAPAIPARNEAPESTAALDAALPVSMLVVPLIARGITLGAVTFIAPADAPPFDPMDRDTAEEFAGRLALALTQAHLTAKMDVAETQYRLLFEGIHDAVLVADAAGNYTDANSAFTDLVGYTLEEVRRSRVGAFARDPEGEVAALTSHRFTERWHDETELVRKDGVRVPVERWTTATHTATGLSYLSIWRGLPAQGPGV